MLLPFPVVGSAVSADPRSAETADGASVLTRLICGILLGGRAFVYEAATRVLEVSTNEPLNFSNCAVWPINMSSVIGSILPTLSIAVRLSVMIPV